MTPSCPGVGVGGLGTDPGRTTVTDCGLLVSGKRSALGIPPGTLLVSPVTERWSSSEAGTADGSRRTEERGRAICKHEANHPALGSCKPAIRLLEIDHRDKNPVSWVSA